MNMNLSYSKQSSKGREMEGHVPQKEGSGEEGQLIMFRVKGYTLVVLFELYVG